MDQNKNDRYLGLSVIKFEYDIILTSQLVISSSILLFIVDFTYFLMFAKFDNPRLTNKGINPGEWGTTLRLTHSLKTPVLTGDCHALLYTKAIRGSQAPFMNKELTKNNYDEIST